LPRLALTRPRAIVYVSCDPVTRARDLAGVVGVGGYEIAAVTPLDMFPGADRVEVMGVLVRGSGRRS
jgi:23S rRNA (uracil1939-C5)-methyltransferase